MDKISQYTNDFYSFFYLVGILFLLTVLIEFFFRRNRNGYDKKESAADVGTFCIALAIGFIPSAWLGAGAIWWSYEYRLFTMPDTWWSWGLLFLATDYILYWEHRLRHEVRILWATHEQHHSSPELNFATGLRIADTFKLVGWFLFHMPVAYLGWHPAWMSVCMFGCRVWAGWTHQEKFPKLGFLEYIFVTPNVHRMHHAKNVEYIDKNYGCVLAIWDILHGTYVSDKPGVECKFGVLGKQAHTYNPFIITFREFGSMFSDIRRAKSMKELFMYVFALPGWSPEHGYARTVKGMRERHQQKADKTQAEKHAAKSTA